MADRGEDATGHGPSSAASSGIQGLDQILRGGFRRDDTHLVQGGAGTGKTTLALQFLLAGVRAGEICLYITLSQTKRALEAIARSHGWSLEGMKVHELSPAGLVDVTAHQTVLHTSEVELGELTGELRKLLEQTQPSRVAFDSIDVLGLLAGSTARYHQEILSLRQFFAQRCTAMFLSDDAVETERQGTTNTEFYGLAGSVVHLEQTAPDYGEVRRRVRVVKIRGVAFQGGYHDFRIKTGGLEVYPRIGMTDSSYRDFGQIASGIETLDELLGGGLERGTTCLIVGPPGAGKSTLAAVYACAAAREGGAAAGFLFDERSVTWQARTQRVGIDIEPHLSSGRIFFEQLDPAQIVPGEFADKVRKAVEDRGARVVVIDSLTGYFNSMRNVPMLVVQMHELLTFLSERGVLTILLVSQEGFMSVGTGAPVDISYLSDTIIVLRQFEAGGAIRRCLAAVKKRQGEHETTIRELSIQPGRVTVSKEPLREFRSILSGDPEPIGDRLRTGGR